MAILFFLVLVSLVVASGFLLAYLWAARTGQFDDSYTPAVRMLFDDEIKQAPADETDGATTPIDSTTKTN